MENQHWKNEKLFDDRPYIVHHYIFPNVVELKPVTEVNTGHDDGFDDIKAQLIKFPGRTSFPDLAA